jgi:excisionase family DNA binding protein
VWAVSEVSPKDGSSTNAGERLHQLDSGIGRSKLRDAAVVKVRQRGSRLEPLLTVGETAAILNVSVRTVRRLIASGAISAVSIGRSVRLSPLTVGRLIAKGGIYND